MLLTKINNDTIGKFNYPSDPVELYTSIKPRLDRLFAQNSEWHRLKNGVCTYYNHVDSDAGKSLHHWPELQPYLDIVQPAIQQYAQAIGLDPGLCEIRVMWANTYENGGQLSPHRHLYPDGAETYGVLCYLIRPEDSGNLFIRIPSSDGGDDVVHEVKYGAGDVVIFPSHREHWTGPNLSSGSRILLGLDWYQKPSICPENIDKI